MSANAKVTVTLVISNLGTWGEECTVGQIRKQAMEEARGRLARVIRESEERNFITVLGDLSVVDIVFGENK